eukprot:TRINITY_DN2884_c0_g1_i1.p1 TRINITY_DN2884_c0_g1~~TRINITY_DN2884_c0_g1_i1.p1  ORF type:complete len:592 (+),score=112.35 TRINITY_DN2884_c0_g1_i1:87-1862(+)
MANAACKILKNIDEPVSKLRKGGVAGVVGAVGYSPLYPICRLVASSDVEWTQGAMDIVGSLDPEMRSALAKTGSPALLHIAVFDPSTERVLPWPTFRGSFEVEVKLNNRLVNGTMDEDGQVVPNQMFLTVPASHISSDKMLNIQVKQRIKPVDYPPEREWADIHTILVLICKRIEPMDLAKSEFSKLKPAQVLTGSDEVSMQTEISFKDPASQGKMVPPMVRGASCTHLQCFDLLTWLNLAFGRGAVFRWNCPVCNEKLPWDDIVRDKLMEDYSKAHPDVESMTLDSASWGTPGFVPDSVVKFSTSDGESGGNSPARSKKPQQRSSRKRTAATEPAARSSRRKKPAHTDASIASTFITIEEYVRLASKMTILLKAGSEDDFEETLDILKDLMSLPKGKTNLAWVVESGLLRILKNITSIRSRPDCAETAISILKKFSQESLESGAEENRVTNWVSEQRKEKKRPVVSRNGGLYELVGEGRLCKMVQCPLFAKYFAPSKNPEDIEVVPPESVDKFSSEKGKWILDEFLGECFKLPDQADAAVPPTTAPHVPNDYPHHHHHHHHHQHQQYYYPYPPYYPPPYPPAYQAPGATP